MEQIHIPTGYNDSPLGLIPQEWEVLWLNPKKGMRMFAAQNWNHY